MQMTEEVYQRLKPFEKHLRRAYYGNYLYGINKADYDIIFAAYRELGGKEGLWYTCNVCLLKLLKIMGGLYYPYAAIKGTENHKLPDEVVEAVLMEPIGDEKQEEEKQDEEKPVEEKPKTVRKKPVKKRKTTKKTTKDGR